MQFGGDRFQRDLARAGLVLELHNFRVESAKFALHAQRAGFIGAAAGDHAALIGGAVGSDESELWIVARESFRSAGIIREIGGFQAWQKLFGRGAQRIAKFHKFIEPGDHSVFRRGN